MPWYCSWLSLCSVVHTLLLCCCVHPRSPSARVVSISAATHYAMPSRAKPIQAKPHQCYFEWSVLLFVCARKPLCSRYMKRNHHNITKPKRAKNFNLKYGGRRRTDITIGLLTIFNTNVQVWQRCKMLFNMFNILMFLRWLCVFVGANAYHLYIFVMCEYKTIYIMYICLMWCAEHSRAHFMRTCSLFICYASHIVVYTSNVSSSSFRSCYLWVMAATKN